MQNSENLDIESLILPSPAHTIEIVAGANRSKDKFLRGPVKWSWLAEASRLPGCALHVGVAIHFLNGFRQTGTVKLSPSVCRELGLKRHTVYRAVDQLEAAGLVTTVRKRGSSPVITLCKASIV